MTTASKEASGKRKLTHYVTNTGLNSQFRGASQQFVLHFNEQFRRLDKLTYLTERMPESINLALLQNAVKDIPQLSIVETLDEYTSTTSGAGSCTHLTYTCYYNLIFSLMVMLDMILPILPLPLREGMYLQQMVPLITIVLNMTGHRSLQT